MIIYYAQNKEDLIIKGFFPDVKNGFYVDVGANDPDIDSVTKIFYNEGWHGINVEPSPRLFKKFVDARPKDININAGISSKISNLSFREYINGDGLSTFDQDMKKSYRDGTHSLETATKDYKDYNVSTLTLDDLYNQNNVKHIHFLKIDVEGFEYEVISGAKWEKYRPELICIEANHIGKQDWRPILDNNGYEEVFFDGLNLYYLANESKERRKYFDYPTAVISGEPISYRAYLRDIKPLERSNYLKKEKIDGLEYDLRLLKDKQGSPRYLLGTLFHALLLKLKRGSEK